MSDTVFVKELLWLLCKEKMGRPTLESDQRSVKRLWSHPREEWWFLGKARLFWLSITLEQVTPNLVAYKNNHFIMHHTSVGQACKRGLHLASSASWGASKDHLEVFGWQLLWRFQDHFKCMLSVSEGRSRSLGSKNPSLPPCSFGTSPHGLSSMLFRLLT